MNSLISVIVPVYNVSEYLGMCLDSLLQQTHHNVEIIAVDDGSTDNSGQICDKYADRYPDRILVVHTENHGLSAARNVGMKASHGEYIGFVDSDDWVEPEMFEVLLNNLLKYYADISSCGLKNDFNNGLDRLDKTADTKKCDGSELFKLIIENHSVYGYVCNKLFKKELIGDLLFDESLMSCEDIDFTVRYAENCQCGVYTISELYHYRQRLGSMTGDFNYNPRKLSIIKAYEGIMPIYDRICPEYSYVLLRNYLKININVIGRMRISNYQDEKIENMLSNNIHQSYYKVMRNKQNSKSTRINIWLSHRFPGGMLKLKQILLKRKYKA